MGLSSGELGGQSTCQACTIPGFHSWYNINQVAQACNSGDGGRKIRSLRSSWAMLHSHNEKQGSLEYPHTSVFRDGRALGCQGSFVETHSSVGLQGSLGLGSEVT